MSVEQYIEMCAAVQDRESLGRICRRMNLVTQQTERFGGDRQHIGVVFRDEHRPDFPGGISLRNQTGQKNSDRRAASQKSVDFELTP